MNIGIDLIAVAKFKKLKRADYKHWSRIFSSREWKYAFKDKSSAEHLAGMFAGKEAAMKATGFTGVKNYRKFEITHGRDGAPKINTKRCKISISHNQGWAIAVVLVG